MGDVRFDVVVAGAGNAALCAALAAREGGASVLVLERAPARARGGNSLFTGGLVRFPFGGLDDLRELLPELGDEEADTIEVAGYTQQAFYEDLARITEYEADPELAGLLTGEAYPAMRWMAAKGIRFGLAFGRQAFKRGDKFHFWGNAPVEFAGGGVGLTDGLFEVAKKNGVEVWYGARARKLVLGDSGEVVGIRVRRDGKDVLVGAGAVVLATGGFEANPEMRAKYLGPNWDVVKVRGTEYNTGDGITMALEVGAEPYGNWSGCHAVAWDANAPPMGNRKVGDAYQKHSYPFGLVVNKLGKRFLDEGADFRNYTYAKYGKEVLGQPGRVAFQLFDDKVMHLLRDEYRIREVTKGVGETLEEVAEQLEIDAAGLVRTVETFNGAAKDGPFDPTVLDGKGTSGIDPPKTNWSLPIDTPPFVAYAVTCGITFTFGGLRVSPSAEVLEAEGQPIRGLTAAGELVGGLFYHNYPGGTGLTSGAVYGRIAGKTAADFALARRD